LHAAAWQSTAEDRAAAITAVKQAAAGRADLLAECAGLALGYGERQPDAACYRQMAELCIAAGADKTLIQRWIGIGRQRAATAAAIPYTGYLPSELLHPVQVLGEVTHAPGQPVRGHAGPFVSLPGRIAVPPGLGAVLACLIEYPLGLGEAGIGGIEHALGLLHRGQGIGEHILGRGQPAPQPGQLPDRLTASPCPVCHPTIIASRGGSDAEDLAAIPRDVHRDHG
jgi:hypothetical protein